MSANVGRVINVTGGTAYHTHSEYAAVSHNHAASDINSGEIPVERGGTGANTAAEALTNLGAAAVSHNHAASDIDSGEIPIERGGTGANTAAGALTNLGAAAVSHNHAASDIDSGEIPVERGGTGANTAAGALTNLGAAAVSHNHAASDIDSGEIPVERGGTGANTAAGARTNLGAAVKPLILTSDPTEATVGELGQHAINTTDETEWTCVAINAGAYTWTQGTGGGGGLTLSSVYIAAPPTKTAYKVGETFNPAGMVVKANYTMNGVEMVTGNVETEYTYSPTTALTESDTSVTISLTKDGVTLTATQPITVTKTQVTVPTLSGTYTFNGNTQTFDFDNEPNSSIATKGGDISGYGAGDYTTTFTLNDPDAYEWATTFSGSISVNIAKATPEVTVPTAKTLTYNNTDQALVNAGVTSGGTWKYSTNGTDWSETVPEGHNAGNYTVHFKMDGGTNYTDIAADSVTVTIAHKETTLTLDPNSVTLDADHLTGTVNITTDGDGALSAESSADSVATASIDGLVVTISHVDRTGGTATITIRQAEGTNYAATSATVNVTANFFSATLNVTAVAGATVTATSGSNSYSGVADSTGLATIDIGKSGTYSVTGTYQDAASNSQNVSVTQDGDTYSTTLSWITLALTAPAGSSITLTNGTKTFTGTATGSAVTYYLTATGTWTATAEDGTDSTSGSVNASAYTAYTLKLAFVNIYGATWDGTSTTKWTRTDAAAGFVDPSPYVSTVSSGSSPFDDLFPWSGMKRTTDSVAGELVEIPKFWYKLTQNGKAITVQIADTATEGFAVSPAHMDRGDGKGERDKVYIGRYHCATSTYKSTTGVNPMNNQTRATFRTSIKNLGTGIYMADFAMRFTIWLLYIVEFADWNSQATIGKGCGNGNGVEAMGYTDSMPYHTGTTLTSKDTYGIGTQYRYIEGLWDLVRDWIDGCYNSSAGFNIILNPANSSDSSGGTSVGTPSNGWPTEFTVSTAAGFPMFYASTAGGGESVASCDYWGFNASGPCVVVGGYYFQSADYGLFYVYDSGTSVKYAGIGSRLMKLP